MEAARGGIEMENIMGIETGSVVGPVVVASEKKPNNGWTTEQEELMAEWADIASCYRWLHDQTEKRYARLNLFISVPTIIISTLTGTANFGMGSFFGNDQDGQRIANLGIGGISLVSGMLGTLGNFLRFAQSSEAHRVASIAWGKFQRLIAVELAMNPDERMDAQDFLKVCRSDLDRLIEQSPAIPDKIIRAFEARFGRIKNVQKPDICGDLKHTKVFQSAGPTGLQRAGSMIQAPKSIITPVTPSSRDFVELTMPDSFNSMIDSKVSEYKKARGGV